MSDFTYLTPYRQLRMSMTYLDQEKEPADIYALSRRQLPQRQAGPGRDKDCNPHNEILGEIRDF